MGNKEILMARLIGLLLTDGGVCQIAKRWRIHFTSNSEPFVEEFETLIKKLFNLRMVKEYRNSAWKVQAWISRKTRDELLKYSPTYRTLNIDGKETKAKIPNFIKQDTKLANEFLKYAFTADGSVRLNVGKARYGYRFDRTITIFCKHTTLRKQYFNLLKRLGYKPTMLSDGALLRRRENLIKFTKEIGFVKNVRISGNGPWNGITKANFLRFAANSYNLKPRKIGKNKYDIQSNLKKLALRSGNRMI